MRVFLLLLLVSTAAAQLVDRTQPLPQTPRQALIEILNSQDASAIEKHLPEITRKKMRELGPDLPTGLMFPAGGFFTSINTPGGKMEVFEAGTMLARFEDPRTNDRMEVNIENEDFRGEEDEFELSFHVFKNGEPTMIWYTPRVLLHMKQEAGIWRFTEVGFSAKVPIGDPAFLDAMGKELARGHTSVSPSESSAVASLRALLTSEIQYASQYPAAGFTCTISDLGPPPANRAADEHHAWLIDSSLTSGRKNGYQFSISNCSGSPVHTFKLSAVPEQISSATRRAFCSDESMAIKYSTDGSAETCLANGKPLQ